MLYHADNIPATRIVPTVQPTYRYVRVGRPWNIPAGRAVSRLSARVLRQARSGGEREGRCYPMFALLLGRLKGWLAHQCSRATFDDVDQRVGHCQFHDTTVETSQKCEIAGGFKIAAAGALTKSSVTQSRWPFVRYPRV